MTTRLPLALAVTDPVVVVSVERSSEPVRGSAISLVERGSGSSVSGSGDAGGTSESERRTKMMRS